MPITIGVDIGGSHISSAAINNDTNTIITDTLFQGSINNKANKETILKDWANVINQTLLKINGEGPEGIGFAMPGPFQYGRGVALFKGNDKYEALYGVSVASDLSPLLIQPKLNMRFLNDAASFGIGASVNTLNTEEQNVVAITLGTGFGAAFLKGNVPVVNGDDIPSGGRLWDQPFLSTIADNYFSTRWFLVRYKQLKGNNLFRGVKEIIDNDREIASLLFQEFADNLSKFLLPYLQKFKADVLIIGGSITKSQHLFLSHLLKNWKESNYHIKISIINNTEESNILGASYLFDPTYWKAIKSTLPEF
ncbi:hypothetical protein GCM10011506_02530 [Marivirga lumbricoides]|uniref:ROK family protein n=1 Tax=Marivirga lumbricoides TaxID=1046115 RepID=A0ABQ1LBG0_9BACT|nr:hypothetical protein GCM10011506_02530 [Marivirga lumbricoides]